ncbi:glycosyltransferase family 4 protein [Palleronia abyssalis]|uniref:D-inositol 3-phosphate glycosyltransferase n=1 Tax=Palleronia abyssalis TaxID=1501240 RepID=A0A2R8BSB3_9RHOB|nr:glycosyltransferase family 1 protein [Palleronia abyssalis]SPJ23042.1 D-inositol 3-phosphate glycosyltransferase [Palleronia abyssalis]
MTIEVAHFTRRPAPGGFSLERVFRDVRTAMPDRVRVVERQNRFLSQGILPRLRDAWAARRYATDVNHITGDVHYLTFFLPRARTLLTVHDTVLVEREAGLKRWLLWFFWFRLPAACCARMTAISEESKQRVLSLIRIDPDRIDVIPDPVSPDFQPVPARKAQGKFRLLHIGTKPNKNLERVLEALSRLDIELTIIGKLTDRQSQAVDRSGLAVRTLSHLSDADIRGEYARADALIFVSLDEGFGLPIVEANATGRPVITSARAPMDAIAGDAAVLVDPTDPQAIREAVTRLSGDADLRGKLVERGYGNARRFRADAVAAQYADLYQRIADEAEGRPK